MEMSRKDITRYLEAIRDKKNLKATLVKKQELLLD